MFITSLKLYAISSYLLLSKSYVLILRNLSTVLYHVFKLCKYALGAVHSVVTSAETEQQTVLHEMGLLSAKPVLYACNVGEDDLMEGIENNKYVPLVAARAKEEGARYIPICAKTEEDIADYSPEEKKAFLAEMGIEASGLDNLITASYDLLGLISFLTDGKKECRAWTIRKGTKAPQAAGKIHSDFERGFIRASVIGYNDLEANNFDYAAVKAKGLQRTEGKEYVVHDGDVIEFLFNV